MTNILARWCLAVALLVGWTSASLAQATVDCSTPGALQTAISALTANETLTITGICTLGPGPGFFFVNSVSPVTLAAGDGGATIEGQISISMPRVALTGLTIDGNGITPAANIANGGVVVAGTGGAFVAITNCTIENWSGNGVYVANGAGLWIDGGTVTNNGLAGLLVNGGTASLADSPGGLVGSPVTISSNGTGISIMAGGSATMVNGSIENNTNDGVDVIDHSSIVFSTDGGAGTAITGNVGGVGVLADQGSNLTLGSGNVSNNGGGGLAVQNGSNASIGSNVAGGTPDTATQITGNSITGTNYAGAGIAASASTVAIDGATITGNATGSDTDSPYAAAVEAIGGSLGIKAATISAVSRHRAITGYSAELLLQGVTVTGPNNANTLLVEGGSKALLISSIVTANDPQDPTILAADGSTVDSGGGNTICTGTLGGSSCTAAPGGNAVTVSNGSTFHEISTLNPFGGADTITGSANVEMQSNMEMGTGTTPSSWTGGINVVQNSSFRLDSGITITGGVTLGQGSNGFFNRSLGGSNSAVTGRVTCAGSSSHVAGPTFVVTASGGSTSAVTIVTTGTGCYNF